MSTIKFLGSMILLLLVFCQQTESPFADGVIEIAYRLNETENIEPSYQTVIWLEDSTGNIHTLLVSEYLSYGGYNDTTICRTWSRKVNWDTVSDSLFDAVTAATPAIGQNRLTFDCQEHLLKKNNYQYNVLLHITEDYNILYQGELAVFDSSSSNEAQVDYIPSRHTDGYSALSDVTAKYILPSE